MIKTLKKHKYKLLTLMLSIVSIFTLFLGINKTYAYETDTLSYTINNVYDNNNNIINTTTIDNKNGYIFNQNITYNLSLINSTSNHQYFMINFYLIDSNNNIITNIDRYDWDFWLRQTSTQNIYYMNTSNRINNNGFFTFICKGDNQNESIINSIYMRYSISSYLNYNIFVFNLDYVNYTDIGITQYYDTYYGQIEQNYNSLLSDYNDLQDNYDTLEVNYGDLQDDYEELETNYNTLQDNYNELEDKTSYGIFGYLQDANFQYDIQNTPQVSINNQTNFVLSDLQQLGIISSGGNYNAYYFETNYNPNYYGVIGNFYFNSSLPLTLIDLTFKDMDGALVEIVDDEGGSARFNITSNLQTINYNNILELSSSFSNFVDEIHIKPNNADLMGSMFTSSSYNVGYLYGTQIGFKNGRDSLQSTVDSLNNRVNELEQQNQYQYNSGYQNGLNVGANQNLETAGMKTLFNSILSYPVNMIRSVFDFEFMGINVTSLIMFIVSIGIVAFVIKKFL